ncbi:zinc-ribbon domain-containing protein [Rathayibacter soli]|uniref:zinc-ribbon domain-containing protein n=1 Tax=Rathayibacter soli TaxID=3144168 RepID=UPI0027E3B5CD|nr:zinc-ribbon domain-containing protein [Glaciibacter superstes]
MAEPVQQWWARRQFTHDREVPYPVGTYRAVWAPFPVLIRQYHPDLNHGITLTQIPPAAEVLLRWQCDAGHIFVATPAEQRNRPGKERRRSSWCPECRRLATGRPTPSAARRSPAQSRPLCGKTPDLPVATAFVSVCAPKPASAIEGELRTWLRDRLAVTHGMNAIRLGRPFFDHLEVWPDVLLPELRIAIEYDSTGRHGLEHVGRRQKVDERKDRVIRATGWEVIRIRTGKLPALGPYDVIAAGLSRPTYALLLDQLRAIRGPLFVDAYLM